MNMTDLEALIQLSSFSVCSYVRCFFFDYKGVDFDRWFLHHMFILQKGDR